MCIAQFCFILCVEILFIHLRHSSGNDYFWIGLKKSNGGTYSWTDNTPVTYTNWVSG